MLSSTKNFVDFLYSTTFLSLTSPTSFLIRFASLLLLLLMPLLLLFVVVVLLRMMLQLVRELKLFQQQEGSSLFIPSSSKYFLFSIFFLVIVLCHYKVRCGVWRWATKKWNLLKARRIEEEWYSENRVEYRESVATWTRRGCRIRRVRVVHGVRWKVECGAG